MYALLKPLFFTQDPEHIHEIVMKGLQATAQTPALRQLVAQLLHYQDQRLQVERFGLRFPNPIGLAAGFDKNALAVRAWPALGFGALEIGTVTALAQPGNPKPRLFRLPDDLALINRMGFNNDGSEAIAARLQALQLDQQPLSIPLGINLGKSKITELEDAPQDYQQSMERLHSYADYFVINVSSPNTPNLRQLQDKDRLEELLQAVQAKRAGKPVLLKIAPDLTWTQIDEVLELVLAQKLAGIITNNTTISREGLRTKIDEAGGLSGRPLTERSLEILKYVRAQVGSNLPIISVGGIFSPEDAYMRIRAGASLLQIYTSFIYNGPESAKLLNLGLLHYMDRDGVRNIEDLIGVDAR